MFATILIVSQLFNKKYAPQEQLTSVKVKSIFKEAHILYSVPYLCKVVTADDFRSNLFQLGTFPAAQVVLAKRIPVYFNFVFPHVILSVSPSFSKLLKFEVLFFYIHLPLVDICAVCNQFGLLSTYIRYIRYAAFVETFK